MIGVTYSGDFARWQRDFRFKEKFILRKKFADRLEEMMRELAGEIAAAAPEGLTGLLKKSFVPSVLQFDENSGNYLFAVTTNMPYAASVEKGRKPGRVPFSKIRDWANHKIPGISKQRIFNIWRRIRDQGFIHQDAPYYFMENTLEKWQRGRFREIMNMIGLDIEKAFAGDVA